jgi:nucleoid DNA-binding protein
MFGTIAKQYFFNNTRDLTMAVSKKRKPAKKKVAKKKVIKKKPIKKTVAKKKVIKKKVAKKVVKKKVAKKVIKKKVAPKKPLSLGATKKAYTKSEVQRVIAEHVGITKKQVGTMLEALTEIVKAHIKPGATGVFKLDILKIERIRKPAKKARKGINPFTGEEMMFKAKPAHNVVKIRALKKLKEMA